MTQDISTKYIELNSFLKVVGIANTGGRAKLTIRAGEIKVNDEIEIRNKRKLHAGDTVEFDGRKYIVDEKVVR